jgi:hypothetical protein
MPFEARSAETMELTLHSQAQGHAFVMEQARLGHLSGVMSTREGLVHRIINESGGGQARAFLPAGMGGAPTTGGLAPIAG